LLAMTTLRVRTGGPPSVIAQRHAEALPRCFLPR